MDYLSSTTALIIFVSSVVIGVLLRIKAYGGKNGERYRKMQMQGPFVPVSQENTEENVVH